jgi:hypothetical protein
MEYTIYASLREEINSGWVWVNNPPQEFKQRGVVCISRSDPRKKVYCEILRVDANYREYYNKTIDGVRKTIEVDTTILIMSEWYRKKLGDLSTQSIYELQITEVDKLHGKLKACLHHPQVVVRVATWLGIISVIEGLIGFGLGLVSLCR